MAPHERTAVLGTFSLQLGANHVVTVAELFALFAHHGIDGYVCGGIVRDLLVGDPYNDIDFTFHAHIDDLRKILCKHYGPDIIQFYNRDFGLLKLGTDPDRLIDITMYRSADSIGASTSLEDVRYGLGASLLEDARNRDLSINCMYWNDRSGLHDPLGHAMDDIAARRIRVAADPRKARIDPRISMRSLLFQTRQYVLSPCTHDYLLTHLDANILCYPQDKFSDYVHALVRGRRESAHALYHAACGFLPAGTAREQLARACNVGDAV
ncbi:hypothetical protein KY495_03670 [Massilia sp. PAMC28688]|uniref:hypothetical protein n=1 Tax=Massilia sp. PAMC28688 TaxID=2861283 RepID=UPI001C62AE09|nr:hypothetical protein [Massilia sp. PAMC28688]QYF94328.1 hypothetical protein KY495_03670 [Massilia sp. PAMC28688]